MDKINDFKGFILGVAATTSVLAAVAIYSKKQQQATASANKATARKAGRTSKPSSSRQSPQASNGGSPGLGYAPRDSLRSTDYLDDHEVEDEEGDSGSDIFDTRANALDDDVLLNNLKVSVSNSVHTTPRYRCVTPPSYRLSHAVIVERVMKFSTACAKANVTDRTEILRIIEAELGELTGGATIDVWVLDDTTQLLLQHTRRMVLSKNSQTHIAARVYQSGVSQQRDDEYACPMVAQGSVIAVIHVRGLGTGQPLSPADGILLDTMAGIAGSFLQNAYTFEKLADAKTRAQATLRLVRSLSDNELDESRLVKAIMDACQEVCAAERVCVHLHDRKRNMLHAYIYPGMPPRELPVCDSGLCAEVLETGEAVNIKDVNSGGLGSRYSDLGDNAILMSKSTYLSASQKQEARSVLALPIIFSGQIIAVVILLNKTPANIFGTTHARVFTSQDESHFMTLSPFMAVCLRNCRVNEDLTTERDRGESILQTCGKIVKSDIRDRSATIKFILHEAQRLLSADRASIFLLDRDKDQLRSQPEFNTSGLDIRLPYGSGIVGKVFKTGKMDIVNDAYTDSSSFHRAVDAQLGYVTSSMITVPIFTDGDKGSVIAVAQLINKTHPGANGETVPFEAADAQIFNQFALFAGRAIANLELLDFAVSAGEDAVRLSRQSLRASRSPKIRCGAGAQLPPQFRKPPNLSVLEDSPHSLALDPERVKDQKHGLVNQAVANTTATPPLENSNKDNDDDDHDDGEAPSQKSSRGDGGSSTPDGNVLVTQPSLRTASSDSNSTEDDLTRKHRLELTVLEQLTPTDEEIAASRTVTFDMFAIRRKYKEKAPDAVVQLITELFMSTGLPQRFDCDRNTILNFVLACRRKYRTVPYHNFFHAADVCQTLYCYLYPGKASEYFSQLECYALLVVGLTHDLDHMGLNNSYHLKTESPLGILSSATGSTCVLEVHHCNLAFEILESSKQNVFKGMSVGDRVEATRLVVDCILATDMARHGEFCKLFKDLTLDSFDRNDQAKRLLALQQLTKAADISNVSKPFRISKLWAASVTEEFYRQGDLERKAGVDVLPMNDRSLGTELAKGQLGFINFLAEGFFLTMVRDGIFSGLSFATDNIATNKEEWQNELDLSALATGKQ